MTLLILLYAGFSLLLIGLSVPLIQGRVKPNGWYGFRIPLTLNHSEIWYPANRYAGWLLLAYAVVLLITTLGLPFLLGVDPAGPPSDLYAICVAAVTLAGLFLVFVLSWRYARRLAKKYETDALF